ncbi:MAG: hypothetical protein QNJ98_10210 [Planctomycetota bacterium]|nr:hypothetical protein [Planctomycetota bacterium]
MKSPLRYVLPMLALCALFLSAGLDPVAAEVIHLKTGESVKGRPVIEESNEEILVIEDLVRGSLRRIRWEAVDTEVRKKLWQDWGWERNAARTIVGDVIVQEQSGGKTEELRGKIEREEGGIVYFRSNGQLLPVRAETIKSRRKEEMDARDIWTAEQLWDKYVADLKANQEVEDIETADARTRFNAANDALWMGYLEKARDLFRTVADDPNYINANVAKKRLEYVDELIRDAEARESLKEMRRMLSYKNFRKFKEAQQAFPEKHPEYGEAVKILLERLGKDFEKKRSEYFRHQARFHFPKICEKLIEKKVKEKDISVTDVTSWTRRELPEAAFLALSERFANKDDITPEEAQQFWSERTKRNWITRSYGEGTFVVKPAKIKPPSQRRNNANRNRQGRSQAAPKIKVPKPPTREQWWARAKSRERTAWTMAYFAERSGLFEVGTEKLTPCRVCNGQGLERKTLQGGGVLAYICTRCAGTRNDWAVKFR